MRIIPKSKIPWFNIHPQREDLSPSALQMPYNRIIVSKNHLACLLLGMTNFICSLVVPGDVLAVASELQDSDQYVRSLYSMDMGVMPPTCIFFKVEGVKPHAATALVMDPKRTKVLLRVCTPQHRHLDCSDLLGFLRGKKSQRPFLAPEIFDRDFLVWVSRQAGFSTPTPRGFCKWHKAQNSCTGQQIKTAMSCFHWSPAELSVQLHVLWVWDINAIICCLIISHPTSAHPGWTRYKLPFFLCSLPGRDRRVECVLLHDSTPNNLQVPGHACRVAATALCLLVYLSSWIIR